MAGVSPQVWDRIQSEAAVQEDERAAKARDNQDAKWVLDRVPAVIFPARRLTSSPSRLEGIRKTIPSTALEGVVNDAKSANTAQKTGMNLILAGRQGLAGMQTLQRASGRGKSPLRNAVPEIIANNFQYSLEG